jgi:cytochrome c nitrite reductase small subunit
LSERGLAGSTTLLVLLAVVLGLAAGIGGYTFVYAEGLSYMSSESEGVRQLPHHAAAVRLMAEVEPSRGGGLHRMPPAAQLRRQVSGEGDQRLASLEGFTLQDFDEPITIKGPNSRILQDNCLACHGELVHQAVAGTGRGEEMKCVHCHQSVGHGERAGLGGPRP